MEIEAATLVPLLSTPMQRFSSSVVHPVRKTWLEDLSAPSFVGLSPKYLIKSTHTGALYRPVLIKGEKEG